MIAEEAQYPLSFSTYTMTCCSADWKLVYYQSNHYANRSIQNPCNAKRQRVYIISMRHGNAQKNNTHEERPFFPFYQNGKIDDGNKKHR